MIRREYWPAIRAYNKLWSILSKDWDMAESCDAHWDAGEWSGPAWSDFRFKETSRITAIIAERFNLDSNEFSAAHEASFYHEELRFRDSFQRWPARPGSVEETNHKPICHEYWERGLDCQCIPEGVKQDIRNGANPEDVM